MTDAPVSRRVLLASVAGTLGALALDRAGMAQMPGQTPTVPPDPTKVPGAPLSELGQRSPFERPRRIAVGSGQGSSLAPLQDLVGIVTPADLHFERGGKWAVGEGEDGAAMCRSIPMEKAWDDALIAYGQNGEALRPEQGYPARLFLPGWEGNANVKWIRRIEIADRPFMTREETSKYTDPLGDGTARMFSFVMDAKSIITFPAYPVILHDRGWWEISGIAWSGRGRITRVDVSSDGGKQWEPAELQQPVLPKCHTRFRYVWKWDGRETTLLSRAVDETGYVQPTLEQLRNARGLGTAYHFNHIRAWRVQGDGTVVFGLEG